MPPNDIVDVAASVESTADSMARDTFNPSAVVTSAGALGAAQLPVEPISVVVPQTQEPLFDFEEHRRAAVDAYAKVRSLYEEFSRTIANILTEALTRKSVKVHSIQGRAKELESFGRKVMRHSDTEPEVPKYSDPMKNITDLAAARVITFFPRTTDEVDTCLRNEFIVAEKVDHTAQLQQEERLGYQSVHYLVGLKEDRTRLPEYVRFSGLIGEIQVRTVLQHAWAEIEHDIQYKSPTSIPVAIRRRFMAVAGMLEVIDREFQAIQDADSELKESARKSVQHGDLDQVEITADALQAYLDRRFGADARVSDWSYNWMVRVLLGLGFRNFRQVDECISGYDDDQISKAVHGARQGPITRFEDMLLAGMGESFIRKHPSAQENWFGAARYRRLARLKGAGIPIRSYSAGVTSLGQRPLTKMGN
jgi:ppGpp synthetase/RelA/SpoT-type nucleotidyltranferase